MRGVENDPARVPSTQFCEEALFRQRGEAKRDQGERPAMTRSEVSKIRVRSQAEVVLLHQLAERATLLACFVRRMGYVPRVTRQETLDVTTLELFDRLPPGSLKALAGYVIAFGCRPFVRQGYC